MCIAVPVKILSIESDGKHAIVDYGGLKQKISIVLLNDLSIGDFVIVHAGAAITKIDPEEARKTLELMEEIIEDI
ncbi:MAG: HypC/HybG/HupF family hydrogenase formation chaperone [Promethearchaeota archaeon]